MPSIVSRLRELTPRVADAGVPEILWLPGVRFVCLRIETPPEIKPADLEALAALQVEEVSPFPPDSTAWGYFHPHGKKHALLYAAWREGLHLGSEALTSAEQVLPSFLPACGNLPEEPALRYYLHGDTLTVLAFPGGKELPTEVESIEVQLPEGAAPDALPEPAILTARKAEVREYLSAQAQQLPEEPGILLYKGSAFDDEERLVVEHARLQLTADALETAEADPVRFPSREVLWQADVRDKSFLSAERKDRRTRAQLWQGMQLAAVVAALCLLLQLVSWGAGIFLEARQEKLVLVTDEALDVASRKEQLNNLRAFSLTPFRPFEMLSMLNPTRPDTIYFEDVSASEDGNEMKVRGVASSINEVNNYQRELDATGFFERVEIGEQKSQPGKVVFTLELDFLPLVNQAAAEEVADARQPEPLLPEDVQ